MRLIKLHLCVHYRFNSKQAGKKCGNPKAKRYLKQKGSLNLSFTRLRILGSSFYAWNPHRIGKLSNNSNCECLLTYKRFFTGQTSSECWKGI